MLAFSSLPSERSLPLFSAGLLKHAIFRPPEGPICFDGRPFQAVASPTHHVNTATVPAFSKQLCVRLKWPSARGPPELKLKQIRQFGQTKIDSSETAKCGRRDDTSRRQKMQLAPPALPPRFWRSERVAPMGRRLSVLG